MALLTVEQYEIAKNVDLDDGQSQQAQFYIDVVTSYIENITGATFDVVNDEIVRCKADRDGQVRLKLDNVRSVGTITDIRTSTEYTSTRFDGIDTIYGFYPGQVVDVEVSYGTDPADADVVGVAVEAVQRGLTTGTTALSSKTVGDVTYTYGTLLNFSKEDREILENYGVSETTWKLSADHESARVYSPIEVVPPDCWW